ncbi:hypothetical protein ACFL96_11945 [Thermoproteota archaeon]
MKTSVIIVIAVIGYALSGIIGLGTLNLMVENDTLQSELETMQFDSNLLDITNKDQQIEITQIGLKLEESIQNYSSLTSIHKSLEDDLELKIQENKILETDNKLLQSLKDNLTFELETISQEKEVVEIDYNLLVLDNEELISDYGFLNDTFNLQNIELTSLKLDLNESNLENDNLQEQISQIEVTNIGLQENLSSLQIELDEANTEIDDLTLEFSESNIELENLRQLYIETADNFNTVATNYDILSNDYNTLVTNYNTLVTNYDTLFDEKTVLENNYNTLVNNYNNLVSDYNTLLGGDSTLQTLYDNLKVKYDLWRLHSALVPPDRNEYSVIGYIPYAGEWQIDETSFLISFPDTSNCIIWNNLAGTGSMQPAMGGGHTAVGTTCFSNNDLQLGDIIVYDDGLGMNIIHQIIEIRPEGVITKGIHNEVADPSVILWGDILYVVIAIIY